MHQTQPKHYINENLEALRGYAAIFVVFCHMLILYTAFNKYYAPTLLNVLSPTGHLWLLVFFVLSGYVIAISNKQGLTAATIGTYIKKRLIRIYPIYLVSILVTLLIMRFDATLWDIVMNVAMLQVLVVPPLSGNGPAWSLHYELVYYLLFIPLSYFRLNSAVVFFGSLLIALLFYIGYPNPHIPIISSYLFGFAFWMAGLCIARYGVPQEKPYNPNNLIGALFLLLSVNEVLGRPGLDLLPDRISYLLFNFHLQYAPVKLIWQTFMSHTDLVWLPFCTYAVCIFSGKRFKFHKMLCIFIHLIMVAGIALTARKYMMQQAGPHILHFVLSVVYYAISIILPLLNFSLINTVSKYLLKVGTWLGGVSYAVYILHFPLIFAMGIVDSFNTSAFTFAVRLMVFMPVLLGLCYLLEKKMQPAIRGWFLPKT
nr:acyltransferase [uncultured Mucilaginibacter sp.]